MKFNLLSTILENIPLVFLPDENVYYRVADRLESTDLMSAKLSELFTLDQTY